MTLPRTYPDARGPVGLTPAVRAAWDAGYECGESGVIADPPRGYSDLQTVAWFSGFHSGQNRAAREAMARAAEEDERTRLEPTK